MKYCCYKELINDSEMLVIVIEEYIGQECKMYAEIADVCSVILQEYPDNNSSVEFAKRSSISRTLSCFVCIKHDRVIKLMRNPNYATTKYPAETWTGPLEHLLNEIQIWLER